MSRGARWTLGVFCLFFAWTFYYVGQGSPSADLRTRIASGAFAGLCLLISFTCFFRHGRSLIVRFLGGLIFLTYVAYFAHEFWFTRAKPYEDIGTPHWINALVGFFVWGLPGLYMALHGIWPALVRPPRPEDVQEGHTGSGSEKEAANSE
jgi:O-antigen ligase